MPTRVVQAAAFGRNRRRNLRGIADARTDLPFGRGLRHTYGRAAIPGARIPERRQQAVVRRFFMGEDLIFNVTAVLGCVVGGIAGYHFDGLTAAVDGAFFGFVVSAACAALFAELAYLVASASAAGARLLERATPLFTLGILIAIASRFWK